MHIAEAKLCQANAGDHEVKLRMKRVPKWVRTGDPVIRSLTLDYNVSALECSCGLEEQICFTTMIQYVYGSIALGRPPPPPHLMIRVTGVHSLPPPPTLNDLGYQGYICSSNSSEAKYSIEKIFHGKKHFHISVESSIAKIACHCCQVERFMLEMIFHQVEDLSLPEDYFLCC